MRTLLAFLLLVVVEGKKRTDPGIVSIANHPIPSVIQSPLPLLYHQYHGQPNMGRTLLRSTDFTLKLLSINIWGFKWPMSEDKDLRVSKTIEFLRNSDYDIVFMQEAWMFSDFEKIKSVYPYSTWFGSPNSVFCPQIRNGQLLDLQFSALDCNGVTIFSKHPIVASKFVKFTDNIDVLDEKLVQRGFVAATIEVEKMINGVRQGVKVTGVDPHLTSWYGEESLHSSIREKEAAQVLNFADNYSASYGTDLIVIAGDLNSSPGTPVYNKFSQMVDCLVDKFGAASSSSSSHHTWGRSSNSWTGPGGSQSDNHAARIDYIFYRLRSGGRVQSVQTEDFKTVKEFASKSNGAKISLSDHDWVEASLKLNF